MIINEVNFPVYDIIIVLSIILGGLYIYVSLDKQEIPRKSMITFFVMFFIFSIMFGKTYNYIEHGFKGNFLKIGVTGYGGLIGAILAAIIHRKIYKDNSFFKYTTISLPLIYGVAKLACFITGCCYGLPYNGPFKVMYPHVRNDYLFPVQIVETISFIIIFLFCNSKNKKNDIVYITLCIVFVSKFLLDFLRFSHTSEFLSNNQIASIVLLFITLIIYTIKKRQ